MEFEVVAPEKFSPSAQGLLHPPYYQLGARGNFSCYQNPTKGELIEGVYKPRLTLTKRKGHAGFILTLRIEFSVPKLVFGNNFDELSDSDFRQVLDILHRKITEMGIRVNREVLREAPVSAIHYSRNIALTDYSTCSMITNELAKINLTKRLDLSKTDYRNEGHIIRYHSNNYEISFYDKLKDLQQAKVSEKRATEKDNIIQVDLFKNGNLPKHLDIFRMEVRLGNRTKIKAVLTQLDIKAGPTFHELFSNAISRKILLHFWETATKDMPILALCQFKPEDIMVTMLAESKTSIKPAKLLQKLGALVLVQSIGIRGLKALLSDCCNARTLQRIIKELSNLDITANMKYAAIRHVGKAISEAIPLRLEQFTVAAKQGSRYEYV